MKLAAAAFLRRELELRIAVLLSVVSCHPQRLATNGRQPDALLWSGLLNLLVTAVRLMRPLLYV